jgi:hypothetical protein
MNILFYSKYCNICKELLNKINIDDYIYLCVDNVNIRNRILNDTKLKIYNVPCLIIVSNDGYIEKIESDDLLHWLEKETENKVQKTILLNQNENDIIFEKENDIEKNMLLNDEKKENIVKEGAEENIEDTENIVNDDDKKPSKKNNQTYNLAQQMQREREFNEKNNKINQS